MTYQRDLLEDIKKICEYHGLQYKKPKEKEDEELCNQFEDFSETDDVVVVTSEETEALESMFKRGD